MMEHRQIRSVLIANRGEIAARIIRTCKRLGIRSIALYSDADADNLYVKLADEAHALGGESASESYLRSDKIIEIAKKTNADAIHPGYGFLAENPLFAEQVVASGIRFVGPTPDTMRLLGHKHSARLLAKERGVAVAPGYDGDEQEIEALSRHGASLGFPLLVKAAAGGGGKGMRRVDAEHQLVDALAAARREAENFFSDGRLILERIYSPARHIEVQLLADSHGAIVHLFERDCSLQRSYQKLIEEAPARALTDDLRAELYQAAITLGRAVKLQGVATVEFLVSTEATPALPYVFLEVNPRLQVEHPVTEMITGVDIVEQQLLIASGAPLAIPQSAISICGHAIEARVCAENPARNFLPTGGRLGALRFPEEGGLRVEHSLNPGYLVTSNYDSLLAKLIAGAATFEQAAIQLSTSLMDFSIGGIDTNAAFLSRLLRSSSFLQSPPTTSTLLEDPELTAAYFTPNEIAGMAGYVAFGASLASAHLNPSPFFTIGSWRAGLDSSATERPSTLPARTIALHCETSGLECVATVKLLGSSGFGSKQLHRFLLDGTEHSLECIAGERDTTSVRIDGALLAAPLIQLKGAQEIFYAGHRVRYNEQFPRAGIDGAKDETRVSIRSPLPGKLLRIGAAVGDSVTAAQIVAVLESMKMEHSIVAPIAGTVAELRVAVGETVQSGDLLMVIDSGS